MLTPRTISLAAGMLALLLSAPASAVETIFSGPEISFSKPAFADPFSLVAQDRITDTVWISRGENRGIFNPAVEELPTGRPNPGPEGTEWALGSLDDYQTLTYTNWVTAIEQSPLASVGREYVVHLIDEDIYLGLRFTAWGASGSGGTFSYVRTTRDVPEPSAVLLLMVGCCVAGFRRMPRR